MYLHILYLLYAYLVLIGLAYNKYCLLQTKAPFGYSRKDVILIGLGVTFLGIALKSGLEVSSKMLYHSAIFCTFPFRNIKHNSFCLLDASISFCLLSSLMNLLRVCLDCGFRRGLLFFFKLQII